MKLIFSLLISLILNSTSIAQTKANNKIGYDRRFKKATNQILSLFHDHNLVAIDEGHHNSKIFHKFLLALINNKNFPNYVNDIVVEFGSAKYQHLIDDFVMGKEVPDSLLRLSWRETTQVLVWDSPVYEGFFRAVRLRNRLSPDEKKIRVILADPPIEWQKVHSIMDYISYTNRDAHADSIIQKEVIQKGRKAVIVFGGMHLARRSQFPEQVAPGKNASLGELLANKNDEKYFTIWTRINTSNKKVATALKKATIKPPTFFTTNRKKITSLILSEFTDIMPGLTLQARDAFDGFLYLGQIEKLTETVPIDLKIFTDNIYFQEVVRRFRLLNHPALNELLKWRQ